MIVHRWEETPHHYIAILRDDALFDLSTREKPQPDDREVRLRAFNVVSGEMETYAMDYGKGYRFESVRQREANAPDVFSKRDADQLRLMRQRSA